MNCHGHNENNDNNKKSSMKHMLLMVLCCGLPILIAFVVPFLKIGGSFKSILGTITPFICPVMMVFMMLMMSKNSNGKETCHKKNDESEI